MAGQMAEELSSWERCISKYLRCGLGLFLRERERELRGRVDWGCCGVCGFRNWP